MVQFHRSESFVQFEGTEETTPVDLMVVDEKTFQKLMADSEEKLISGMRVQVPLALQVIALIECCGLDPEGGSLKGLIERYGGPEAAEQIRLRLGRRP